MDEIQVTYEVLLFHTGHKRVQLSTMTQKMATHHFKVSLISVLVMMRLSVPYVAGKSIYIVTSPNEPCPSEYVSEQCMTLQQYTGNENTSMSDEVTLELQPGTHVVRSSLSFSNATSFEMYGTNSSILCNQVNSSKFLHFINLEFVSINGITFTSCRMAWIDSVEVLELQSSTFKDHGPVILKDIENATVSDLAFLGGHGLRVQSSSLQMKQSNFSNLTADGNGLGCSRYAHGAAIWSNNSDINVIKCFFMNNTASCNCSLAGITSCSRGGAMYIQTSSLEVRKSYLIGNTATLEGGALYVAHESNVSIINSTFYLNSATGSMLGHRRTAVGSGNGSGGAVSVGGTMSRITIAQSRFANNTAESRGGALCVVSNATLILVNGSHFSSNTVINSSSHGGGVIYYKGYQTLISIVDTNFTSNSASQCAVLQVNGHHSSSSTEVYNSTFLNNMAKKSSRGNTSHNNGGVACINGSNFSIYNSLFYHNEASGHAGVLHIDNGVLFTRNSEFTNNSAGGSGGVIYTAFSTVNVTIDLCSFLSNRASKDGGVMYVEQHDGHVEVTDTNFFGNHAGRRGGVIAIVGSKLDIDNTIAENNTATIGNVISACMSDISIPDELVARLDLSCDFNESTTTEVSTERPTSVASTTPNMPPPATSPQNAPSTANTTWNTPITMVTSTTNEVNTKRPPSTAQNTPHIITTVSTDSKNQDVKPSALNESEITVVTYATLGIVIFTCVLVLVLYIIVLCIILYICGAFKDKRGANQTVDNPHVYVPLKETNPTTDNGAS